MAQSRGGLAGEMMSMGSIAALITGTETDGIAGTGGAMGRGAIAAAGAESSGLGMIGVLGAVIFGTVSAGGSVTVGGGSVVLGDDGGVVVTAVTPAVVELADVEHGAVVDDCASLAASSSLDTDRRSAVSSIADGGADVGSTARVVDKDDGVPTSAPVAPAVAGSAPAVTSTRLEGLGISGIGIVGGTTIVPSTSGRRLAISTEVDGRGFPIVAIAATAAMTPAPTKKPRGVCTG